MNIYRVKIQGLPAFQSAGTFMSVTVAVHDKYCTDEVVSIRKIKEPAFTTVIRKKSTTRKQL